MKIYYYANQIYQLSYALPYYRRFGGIFIVSTLNRFVQFKKYLRNFHLHQEKTLFRTPNIILRKPTNLTDISGIILSFSNSALNCDKSKCRLIFHEHGASDKPIGSNSQAKTLQKLQNFDYIFLMSPKNRIKLEKRGLDFPNEKYCEIGNLRFDDYHHLDREEEIRRLQIVDPTRKNILYAPTWRFGKGTLKKYFKPFSQTITRDYNLIVRPHFHDVKEIPALRLWLQTHRIKHVYFSNAKDIINADTYKLFKISDLLISDTSAVLYEYLITRKPIIVIDEDYRNKVQMQPQLDIMQQARIFSGQNNICKLIYESLHSKQHLQNYENLLQSCFFSAFKPAALKAEQVLSGIENEI